ncbi:MAG: YadA-like family protein, partial [Pseudoxanthomonas sp.]|nr:YadA-like family protein [Pseudoxanthomonas sp.]
AAAASASITTPVAASGLTQAQAQAIADSGDATTLAAANAYTDGRETAIRTDLAAGDTATLASANAYTDARISGAMTTANASAKAYTDTRETRIRSDMAAADATTLQQANAHADAGDATTLQDARAYSDSTATQTLAAANTYTDSRFAQWGGGVDALRTEMDDRFTRVDEKLQMQDRRIERVGAMAAAYQGISLAGAVAGDNRLGIGVGTQGGQTAVAVGYARSVAGNVNLSLGGAFASGESSVSAGAAFGW